MIIHLINNRAWLLYHRLIPLCIVYDITCHPSGFHSCDWALYPNLYTAFSSCNFCSFSKNRSSRWGSLNPFFYRFSLTRRIFQFLRRFFIIRNFRSFRKNCSSPRGLLNPSFYRFSLTRQMLQFFANFTIFAIFAVFIKIAVLVEALSTPSSTSFHWLDEIFNSSQILQFPQFLQFSSGPSQSLLLQVFTDSTNFPTFCRFYNIYNTRSFYINRSSCWGPPNPFMYRFSLTRRIIQFSPDFKIFAISAVFGKIEVLVGPLSTPSSKGFYWLDECCNSS